MPDLHVKRIYAPPEAADGARILVDRLWPRGIRKEEAALTLWLKDAAPSTALRQWFGHDPARWEVFQQRYRAELAERQDVLPALAELLRQGPVTLLYAAHDPEHNHALVLAAWLREHLRGHKHQA